VDQTILAGAKSLVVLDGLHKSSDAVVGAHAVEAARSVH
jgi:hypothetical protein